MFISWIGRTKILTDNHPQSVLTATYTGGQVYVALNIYTYDDVFASLVVDGGPVS